MQDGVKDEELVLMSRQGDGEATQTLLLRYKNLVRSLARRNAFHAAQGLEIEDLVQEGMVGLYYAVQTYRADAGKSFKNFAYLCVRSRILDVFRKNRHKITLDGGLDLDTLSSGTTPEDSLLYDESNEELHAQLMKSLSDFEFRCMTLYLEGMSYSAIAETTGKDLKSIDNALSRAKKKLQKSFH